LFRAVVSLQEEEKAKSKKKKQKRKNFSSLRRVKHTKIRRKICVQDIKRTHTTRATSCMVWFCVACKIQCKGRFFHGFSIYFGINSEKKSLLIVLFSPPFSKNNNNENAHEIEFKLIPILCFI
jgi:uncharacterized protein (DUF342 family)